MSEIRRQDDTVEFADAVIETAAGSRRIALRHTLLIAGIVIAIAGIAVLWAFTPMRHWLDIERLSAIVDRFGDSPIAPIIVIAMFVVGGLVVIPVNALTAVTILVFGPLAGGLYSLIGCTVSAIVLYEIARRIPMQRLRSRAGARMQRFHHHLVRHAVWAVALVRLVPVAPYSVVCLLLGTTDIRRAPYIAGTALGMLPGIVVNAFFIDRVIAAIRHPSLLTAALLGVAVLVIAALAWLVRRHFANA
ncbi:MAG TPA: VTT domain-containing protein [Rudaea sp.]|jgi:phospholipase D1/2|nr:VTT domain-containing protein [Rudaea sp.]